MPDASSGVRLRPALILCFETFTLLRRDAIFVPALIAALLISAFANLASNWSVNDYAVVLCDIGFFGFQMTGSLAALFWGAKAVSDSRQEGALEVQLAAPISRSGWLFGKYLGLVLCLLFVGVIMLGVWQLNLLIAGFGPLTLAQLTVFTFMVLGWLVLAALGLLLSTLMRFGLAFFAAIGIWLAGLTTAIVATSVGPETPALTRHFVVFLARFWDLQRFNLVDRVLDPWVLTADQAAYHSLYAFVLIAVMLFTASLIFSLRDPFV